MTDSHSNPQSTAEERPTLCPECSHGTNSPALGGNEKCFHCSYCGYVQCVEASPDPTLLTAIEAASLAGEYEKLILWKQMTDFIKGLAATPVAPEVKQVELTRWINYGSEGWNPFDEAAAITQDLGLGFETRVTVEKEDYDRLSEDYHSLRFGRAVPSAEPVAPIEIESLKILLVEEREANKAWDIHCAELLEENARLRKLVKCGK